MTGAASDLTGKCLPASAAMTRAGQLSPRQLEYLRLTAEGLSAKEIAYTVGCAESTVKRVLEKARRRLGVRITVDAFRALGWLRVPE